MAGQQVEPLGRASGGGEQVGAGHHRADEGVVSEREELQVAAAGRGDPGERLVHLGQRRGLDEGGGDVAGGVRQVPLASASRASTSSSSAESAGSSGTSSSRWSVRQPGKPRGCCVDSVIHCALLRVTLLGYSQKMQD